jgi:hypothetical protein
MKVMELEADEDKPSEQKTEAEALQKLLVDDNE